MSDQSKDTDLVNRLTALEGQVRMLQASFDQLQAGLMQGPAFAAAANMPDGWAQLDANGKLPKALLPSEN